MREREREKQNGAEDEEGEERKATLLTENEG